MRLKRHKLVGVPFTAARWTGKEITPRIVVLHDTASRLDEGNAASYLLDNDAKVSVHFVVERSGNIVQQVPTNRRANHAGKSHYHGDNYCNGFSVGIEMVSPGRMQRVGQFIARTWYGADFDIATHHIQEMTTPEHGAGLWMPYPEAQLTAVIELLKALFNGIDTLEDVVTHWYISPGRKVDTNPLFPLDHIRSLILGREDPVEDKADQMSIGSNAAEMVQIEVPQSTLNQRRWPSFNNNIIGTIPDGAVVPVIRRGIFEGRSWVKVLFDGQEGWVVERFAAAITTKGAAV